MERRIDGRPLRDERENYRGPALPVATTVVDHPLTDGVGSLTLNYGTVLNVSTDDRPVLDGERTTRILVNSSGFGYVDANGNGTLDDAERLGQRPVAAVESRGAGRVVVVGDGSGGIAGLGLFAAGGTYATYLLFQWATAGYESLPALTHDALAFTLIVLGVQTIFSSFFMSMLGDR